MEKIDAMKELNAACYEMVAHCETKSSILSAIDIGIITAITAVYASNNFYICSICKWYWWIATIYFGFACLGSLISLCICLSSLLSKIQKDNTDNIFYYKDVSKMSKEKYIKVISDKKILEDMALENIQLSDVVLRKYKKFNVALCFLLYPLTVFIYPFFKLIVFIKQNRNSEQNKN